MRETWYVLEDGSAVDPREVTSDDNGKLVHSSGVAVAMRGDVPSSRGVDVGDEVKDMRPARTGVPYMTRESHTGGGPLDHDKDGKPGGSTKPADAAGDMASLRAAYHDAFGKKPFGGWDADTLRAKMAAREAKGD